MAMILALAIADPNIINYPLAFVCSRGAGQPSAVAIVSVPATTTVHVPMQCVHHTHT